MTRARRCWLRPFLVGGFCGELVKLGGDDLSVAADSVSEGGASIVELEVGKGEAVGHHAEQLELEVGVEAGVACLAQGQEVCISVRPPWPKGRTWWTCSATFTSSEGRWPQALQRNSSRLRTSMRTLRDGACCN